MHTRSARTWTAPAFLSPRGGLQRSPVYRGAPVRVACVLGALLASCANGASIDDDVWFIPRTEAAQGSDDPAVPDDLAGDLEPSAESAEVAADAELEPGSGEGREEGPSEDLPRADQPADGEQDPSMTGGNPEPDLPPDVGVPPSAQPDLLPDPAPGADPSSEPTAPGAATEPDADPAPDLAPEQTPAPVPGAEAHCLEGWEGSSCDVCSGQTQSDRQACRLHIDCYIANDCDPVSCGSLEAACGVNRVGNGFVPKEIADVVYGCMCAS